MFTDVIIGMFAKKSLLSVSVINIASSIKHACSCLSVNQNVCAVEET